MKPKTLIEIAKEHELENDCGNCELYNSNGCVNKRGRIICDTRDYLISQVKNSYKLQEKYGNEEEYNGYRYALMEFFNITEKDLK